MSDPVDQPGFNSQQDLRLDPAREEMLERRSGERRQSDRTRAPSFKTAVAAEMLWTAADVARFLRVGRNRPYELVERGELPCIWIGQRLRFDPVKVREFLARQTTRIHLGRGGR